MDARLASTPNSLPGERHNVRRLSDHIDQPVFHKRVGAHEKLTTMLRAMEAPASRVGLASSCQKLARCLPKHRQRQSNWLCPELGDATQIRFALCKLEKVRGHCSSAICKGFRCDGGVACATPR